MSLNTVREIEHAIRALTPSELEELYAWLDQHCPQPIDAQLEADLEAGRIDDRGWRRHWFVCLRPIWRSDPWT